MSKAAEVIEIMGKMGIKGVSRVRCKVLDGGEREKVLTRNVVGPISLGDVILIKETGIDTESSIAKR